MSRFHLDTIAHDPEDVSYLIFFNIDDILIMMPSNFDLLIFVNFLEVKNIFNLRKYCLIHEKYCLIHENPCSKKII